MNMKIAVDISPLKSGHKGRGTGRYTGLILAALKKSTAGHEIIEHSDTIVSDADLTFYPYFDPFFLTLPLFKSGPVVVTVHDLIPIRFPEHFKRGIRGGIKWQLQRHALKQVDAVITDSEASKRDIVKFTGIEGSKISVVYLAPTLEFTNGSVSDVFGLRTRFHIPGRYILYVGDVNYNKNIPNLLRAFAGILKRFPDILLIFVGRAFMEPGLPETRDILALADVLGVGKNIRRTGYIGEPDLKALYLSADCFVMPSFAEGFGLPLLDALSAGCVTVASKTSSIAEIAGPSIPVDPGVPEDIASGLLKALMLTPQKRISFKRKAAEWASRFTWEKTANETIKVFESVVGSR